MTGAIIFSVVVVLVTVASLLDGRQRKLAKARREARYPNGRLESLRSTPLLGSPDDVARKDARWRKVTKWRDRRVELGLSRIETADELWRWLGLENYSRLVHLADPDHESVQLIGGMDPGEARLCNYVHRAIPKRSGGTRVICAPKPRLKAVQRRIHAEILAKVPLHPAAVAFRSGGSTTAHAAPHVGKDVVLAWDLQDFFPSISKPRVGAFFRWLGYPASVSHVLALLCTTTISQNGPPYSSRTIPQGAPTSPAIANAICFRMDCRLAGLAKKFGASYTRYADDLAFSGDFEFKRGLSRFVPLARRIIADEGFRVKATKTRFMRSGKRQFLTGLNVNDRPSLGRKDFDVLKAILTNAERAGFLESQNRGQHPSFAEHLRGRIAWHRRFHPARGGKLLARLNALEGRAVQGQGGGAAPPSAAPPE